MAKRDLSMWHWAHRLCAVASLFSAVHSFALAGEAVEKAKRETKKRADAPAFEASRKDPIFITSDRLEVDQKKNTIIYKGHVVALQRDMTMRSEVLTAFYSPDMKGLKEVIAEGKVHVTQGNRVATGSRAVFNGKDMTITLTGNPMVRQGGKQVTGERITFYMEQDKAVVEGGTQRVTTTIFPEELEEREKKSATSDKGR